MLSRLFDGFWLSPARLSGLWEASKQPASGRLTAFLTQSALLAGVTRTSGTRSWVQRIVIHGRKRELGLGSTVLVSLSEARYRPLVNGKLAREGGDSLAEKR